MVKEAEGPRLQRIVLEPEADSDREDLWQVKAPLRNRVGSVTMENAPATNLCPKVLEVEEDAGTARLVAHHQQ
jgi:hypothetical protein